MSRSCVGCSTRRLTGDQIDRVLLWETRSRTLVYAEWGRPGDTAVVAVDDQGQPIGAAWYRLFSPNESGYGFVNSSIPELSMAVVDEHRGRGIGRALLKALIGAAASEGFTALSLSVEQDNRAIALYESVGFNRFRLADNAWIMQVDLSRWPLPT